MKHSVTTITMQRIYSWLKTMIRLSYIESSNHEDWVKYIFKSHWIFYIERWGKDLLNEMRPSVMPISIGPYELCCYKYHHAKSETKTRL